MLAATAGAGGRVFLAGRAVDRALLAEIERPAGVLVRLERFGSSAAATPAGTRAYEWPFPLDDGSPSRLQVSVDSGALREATLSSLRLVGGSGALIVAGLMLVLSRLLRRSVVRPVLLLRAAMQGVEGGDYATRVEPSGAEEVRTLVRGFNDMATLVEAQRDRLQALAESDPLTGLANHRRFHQALADAVAGSRSAEVRRVLDRPELVTPAFQPIVSLATGRVAGYEGLSRFAEADGRRPDEWFDLARRCGMGPLLQALALRRMVEVPGRPNRTWLSLNLDAGALATDAVQGALPHDLTGIVIEVTEQELPPDDEALQRTLAGLRARGARIALDDAGAGYAGLQHVVRIRPDIIKLDRSLVRGVDRDAERLALIESFVAFSARTGAALCAEGIETAEELQVLVDAHVDLGHGYRLGRPGPPWASPAPEAARALRTATAS